MADIAHYEAIIGTQRAFFAQGKTKDVAFRRTALEGLAAWIRGNDTEILAALREDLNKAPFEAYATEVGVVLDELKLAIRRVSRWSAPKRVPSSIKAFPARCSIHPEPYGIALIMSPWNYPFMLTIAPLVGAIAAGNCAIVKPSAYSPATSKLIAKMISEVFDPAHVTVVEGGRAENQALLDQRFDYIFFTGSVAVGRTVMEAASKNLTPITLELGGKSPCIVDETANLSLAAKRIVWGKFINAGQTCVAPDYLLVHSSIKVELLAKISTYIKKFFGNSPCRNTEYGKIINQKHYDRLLSLMTEGTIITGGDANVKTRQIAPTVIDNITWDSPIMQEEIFGPLLPVLTFDDIGEVAPLVNARPKPLALYLFTSSHSRETQILQSISFGGGCVNDTVMHLSVSHLPFGGVGESGMGRYHGQIGFETFSHQKSILHQSPRIDVPLRYPPYRALYLKLLKRL